MSNQLDAQGPDDGMLGISASDLIQILTERSSTLANYWNVYSAVVAALIGAFAASSSLDGSTSFKVVASSAFFFFAMSNLYAIDELIQQRIMISSMILDLNPGQPLNALVLLLTPNRRSLITFHLLLDVVVLMVIGFIARPVHGP